MSSTRIGSETGRKPSAAYSQDIRHNKSRYALDWGGVMRFAAPTVGLTAVLSGLVALTLGAGCVSKKPGVGASSNSNVTAAAAVSNAPQPSALQVSPPASTPDSVTPTAPSAPDPVVTQTPTLAAGTGAAADAATGAPGSYTVQRGDTLFRIARQHYGDGKQWTRIATANPGLTPANLKAGQKIVLP